MDFSNPARWMRFVALVAMAICAACMIHAPPALAQSPIATKAATKLKLNASQKTLYLSDDASKARFQLASNQSQTDTKTAASWSTSNPKVVKVDGEGNLTAVRSGKATVTYTIMKSGKKQRAACIVTVKTITPASIALSAAKTLIPVGSELKLKTAITPSNAKDKSISFTSSKPSVASVNQDGLVQARATGVAVITVKTATGGKTAKLKITVTKDFTGTTVRVFAIGNASYKGDDKLPGCAKDVKMIKSAYEAASFSGKKAAVTARTDLTGDQIRKMLAAMSQTGADPTDITVFYYSGHGMKAQGLNGALCGVDGVVVSVKEVQQALDKVPGKVVVMLDCCLSGRYISSKAASDASSAFNQAVIDAFAQAEPSATKALTDSAYKSKYKILTACGANQNSFISNARNDACSVFTDYVALGLGEDCVKGLLKTPKADANLDRVITLKELYTYVTRQQNAYLKKWPAYKQTAQVWPSNDATAVYARN